MSNQQKLNWALTHSLWASLLLHVLFLLSFSLVYTFQPTQPPQPSLDIPAYVYNSEVAPAAAAVQPYAEKNIQPTSQPTPKPQSAAAKHNQNTEAIHLIGDRKTPPKPLVKLLGKGLAAHLVYPRIAADFNLKGITLVGFTLYPDGRVMDAQVVKSSGAQVLDNAALAGVIAMSPLKEVNQYLQEPQFLVVGIIFSNNEPVGRLMI